MLLAIVAIAYAVPTEDVKHTEQVEELETAESANPQYGFPYGGFGGYPYGGFGGYGNRGYGGYGGGWGRYGGGWGRHGRWGYGR